MGVKFKIISVNAFTLAEVLITLGIIGVVTIMTLPVLLKNIEEAQFKTAYKKAYSTISQAYQLAVKDNGSGFGPLSFFTQASVDKYNAIKSNMNVIKECPYNSGTLGKCWAFEGVGLPGHSALDCTRFSNDGNQYSNSAFVSSDGMYWMLYTYGVHSGGGLIAVDVNGEKGPNDWEKDAFILRIDDTSVSAHNVYGPCANLKKRDGSKVDIDFVKLFY